MLHFSLVILHTERIRSVWFMFLWMMFHFTSSSWKEFSPWFIITIYDHFSHALYQFGSFFNQWIHWPERITENLRQTTVHCCKCSLFCSCFNVHRDINESMLSLIHAFLDLWSSQLQSVFLLWFLSVNSLRINIPSIFTVIPNNCHITVFSHRL